MKSEHGMTGNGAHRARFGPFEVDLHTHELWKFGTKLRVVGQPFSILTMLLSRPGELVTREELRNRLWPSDTFVDFNHGLNAAVNKLREALSDSADNPRYVETLPRRGYRFIASVEWLDLVPQPDPVPATLPPLTSPESAVVTAEGTTDRNWTLYFIVAAPVFVFVLVAASVLTTTLRSRSAQPPSHSFVESNIKPLNNVLDIYDPAFSPDGNSLAFDRSDAQPGEGGIFVTAIGSNQLSQLTRTKGDGCPVWSPDGHLIAFSRKGDEEYSLLVVPADATSAERKLDTDGVSPRHCEIDWSPDGKSIAFSSTAGIYLLSMENSAVRRLAEQPDSAEDWGPSFSPDGQSLLFVRNRQVGQPVEIWLTSVPGGRAHRVLSEPGNIGSTPRWSSDGRSVIYSANRNGHPVLWRASLDAPGSPIQILEAGSPVWDPAVSRRGYRLAYERVLRSLSIWQMDLSAPATKWPSILVPSTTDTDQGPGPQFSPDGKKLAYMSDRSGTMEIWVGNRDGSHSFQLTAEGGAGTPRWSPDSQAIVFDGNSPKGTKIFSINLRGGQPRLLTPEPYSGVCPSWSRDGKWIYFGSDHSGKRHIWKVPSAGGTPVQVTYHGGSAAFESPDGKTLYYASTFNDEPEIWRTPVQGGPETLVPLVRPGTWASWQVVNTGILFVGPSLGHRAVLSFYDFDKQTTTAITVLDRVPFWLGATADGKTVAFDQPGHEQTQVMLIDNFR